MKIRETTLQRATNDNADRAPIIRAFLDSNAPWIDNFAGAGGASHGLAELMRELIGAGLMGARTIGPDIAINHSAEALALHEANHPECRHLCEDVYKVDPFLTCKGRCPLLAWFSPTCTFFSRARGAPLDLESVKARGLCWLAVAWAASKVRPRVICLENVAEFLKFGPLHKTHDHGCSDRWAKKHAIRQKNGKRKPCCKKRCQYMTPIKAREGSLFRAFVNKLRRYYKHVEWRVLTASEYGAPTSRKRLFMIASDAPVSWPLPTHGPGKLPMRTAAECIDWSIPCPSIFERDRPLADKTLARIVAGAHKFVLDAAKPFIVPVAYGGDGDRSIDLQGPMRTVCGNRGGHGLVTPYIVPNNSNNVPRGANEPCPVITTGNRNFLATPYLVHRSNGERTQGRWSKGGAPQKPRVYDIQKPVGTLMAGGIKHGLAVPVLIKNNGGHNDDCGAGGQRIDAPMDTLATRNTKSLALLYGVKARGTSDAHVQASGFSLEDPLTTISTGGDRGGVHHATVAAYLVRYNGTGESEDVKRPIGTLTTKERFGLTQITLSRELCDKAIRVAKFLGYDAPLVLVIDGEEWVLVDVGFRMLSPRELYLCQGFPPDYVIEPMFKGKPLSKTAQIKGVGNSVPPIMATIIGRAALATIQATAMRMAA